MLNVVAGITDPVNTKKWKASSKYKLLESDWWKNKKETEKSVNNIWYKASKELKPQY